VVALPLAPALELPLDAELVVTVIEPTVEVSVAVILADPDADATMLELSSEGYTGLNYSSSGRGTCDNRGFGGIGNRS
jgi:L-asparaginase/Glu-tRNA(Gln) amidotransferase subunit D